MTLIAFTPKSALTLAGAALAALAFTSGSASALSIRLTDSLGSVTITDNGVGDGDLASGIIDYDSTLGPALASWSHAAVQSELCMSSCANIAGAIEADNFGGIAETLTLEISHTGYTLPTILPWLGTHAIGGTTPASVEIEAFWSDTNTLFDAKYSIGGPFAYTHTPPPGFSGFSANLTDVENGVSPFSMTTVISITHGAGENFVTQATSIAALAPVPVPAALPLLATAFGIMGLVRARRKA